MKFRHRIAAFGVLTVTGLGLTVFAAPAFATPGPGTSVIYNSVVTSPNPGNLPSVGAEAYSFNEFGNEVQFKGTNRQLTNVTVELSSWGCASGTWYGGDCSTPAGATFNEPITFNIYNPGPDGLHPGTLIASDTQTFAIPYRPSAAPQCSGGRWWDSRLKLCFNGLTTTVTFSFSGVTLPDTVVYGIAYNTSHYGYHPYGESTACYASSGGCGYDSLNIALSQENDVTVGTDPMAGTVWQAAVYGSDYCDNGAAGVDVFRLDSPSSACWTGYVPTVQFKAGARNG